MHIFHPKNGGRIFFNLMKNIERALISAAISIAVLFLNPSCAHAAEKSHVLILHSYHKGYKWTDDICRGIHSVLTSSSVNLYVEYMDTKRVSKPYYFEKLRDLYRLKYNNMKFELILSSDDNAFNFLLNYRDEIFPEVPVVFCGVNYFKDSDIQGHKLFTGVNEEIDFKSTIDLLLKLHPDTRQIAVINDITTTGIKVRQELMKIIPGYRNSVKFTLLENLELADIRRRIQELSHGSIVLYSHFFRDKSGRYYEYDEGIARIVEKCRVPVYGLSDYILGHGIVGGMLASGYYQGKSAANLAARILSGENIKQVPVIKQSPNHFMFDYNQLNRFNIRKADLPKDSILIHQPYSFYSEHKILVWASIACFSILTCIICLLSLNIARRHRAEAELRKNRDLLAAVIKSLPVALFTKGRDGRYWILNDAFAEFIGAAAADIEGRTVFDCWPPEEARFYDQKDTELLENEGVQVHEYRLPHATKGAREGLFTKACFHDADGNVAGLVGTFLDITDRKQMEKALIESEKRYRAIMDDTPAMIYRFLPDGTLTFTNKAFQDHFKKKEHEAPEPPNILNFIPKHDRDSFLRELQSLTPAAPVITYEHRACAPDGTIRRHESISRALFDGQDRLVEYQSIGRDITDIILAREEKANFEKQLQQAQKMEAIGTLAAGIAHDFNNILGAIIGYTEIGLMGMTRQDPLRMNLEQVLEASNRAKKLVSQILAFSRQSEQEKRPIDVVPVVKEAMKLLRASVPTTIDIRQHISTRVGDIFGDPTEFHQVLMNLCTNAANAMRETGGILTVSLDDVLIDAETSARYPDITPGRYLKLTVKDTGQGMSPEVRERIFEPYFTTREKSGGSGLGLSVVHGIVKHSGGAIHVQSTSGTGSTFEVFFPEITADRTEQPKPVTPVPTGTGRILFVDDEKSLVETGRQMLQHLGYETIATTSSINALRIFREHPGRFDLIITDQTMPNMTGAELAVQILAIRPDIPIILCTGFSEIITEEQAKSLGIRLFIMKPIVLRELAESIHRLLNGVAS